MRSSLDYAGFAQLCGRSPIMREIMRAHNGIILRSLVYLPLIVHLAYSSQALNTVSQSQSVSLHHAVLTMNRQKGRKGSEGGDRNAAAMNLDSV